MSLVTRSSRTSCVAEMMSVILLLASHTALAQIAPVPSRLYVPPSSQNGRFAAVPAFKGSGFEQFEYHVSAIKPDPVPPSASIGPKRTGVVYVLPDPIRASALHWERTSDGFAARVKIIAADAKGMRFHLAFTGQPAYLELRVQGDQDTTVFGPVTSTDVQGGEVWLPNTTGTESVLEIFALGAESIPQLDIQIDQINYIFGGVAPVGQFASTGAASYQEYDAACYSGYAEYAQIQQGVAATAKISFIDSGLSYICTGTLLNDRGSTTTPWFATANHCIPNQTVASTLTFHWHYEAKSCGGYSTDSRYSQTSGGAQLLWTDTTYDASFLKLNKPPTAGAVFAGWDSNSFAVGDHVFGIHHPGGDHTMVSEGYVTGLDVTIRSIDTGALLKLNKVQYISGGTEEGSSGSGVFSILNGQAYWKGGLYGGPVNDYQNSSYEPFDNFYSNVRQYLETTAVTDTQAPTAPTSLAAAAVSSSQINLTWTASSDNVGVTAYKVYRGGSVIAVLGNVTSYSNASLVAATTYSYSVQACDSAGNCSGQSASVSVATQQIVLSGNNTIDNCLFDWAEVTYPFLFSPAHTVSQIFGPYYLRFYSSTNSYLATSSGDNNLKYLGPLSSNGILDLGPVASWYDTARCSQTTRDTQSPTVPTGLTATPSSAGQINLTWIASTDNVGVTAYKVYRNGALIQTLGNVTGLSNTGLAASTTYSYAVAACDAAGNCSGQSVTIPAITAPADSINRTNSAKLVGGTWTLTFTILSTWTNTYSFTSVDATPDATGDYSVHGSDPYGHYVWGTYYGKYGDWGIIDSSIFFDLFYNFTFIDNDHLSGCYYQVTPPGSFNFGQCYRMTGVRTSRSFASSASKPDPEALIGEVGRDNRPVFTDPNVVDSYLQLRNRVQ